MWITGNNYLKIKHVHCSCSKMWGQTHCLTKGESLQEPRKAKMRTPRSFATRLLGSLVKVVGAIQVHSDKEQKDSPLMAKMRTDAARGKKDVRILEWLRPAERRLWRNTLFKLRDPHLHTYHLGSISAKNSHHAPPAGADVCKCILKIWRLFSALHGVFCTRTAFEMRMQEPASLSSEREKDCMGKAIRLNGRCANTSRLQTLWISHRQKNEACLFWWLLTGSTVHEQQARWFNASCCERHTDATVCYSGDKHLPPLQNLYTAPF